MPRVSAPLSLMVIAALVIGIAIGALSCVAGLAGGAGHQVHAQETPAPRALASGPHGGHASAVPGAATEDPSLQPEARSSDTRPGSADPATQGHPGMACVATIELHVPESGAPVTAGWFHTPWTASPADCISDLDPPVPRIS